MPQFVRKNGFWGVRVNWVEHLNKKTVYRRKYKQGFKTKREASMWANKFLAKANSGELVEQKIPTFPDYFMQWARIYRFTHITEVTKNRYIVTASHLESYFGSKPLNKITRSNYQEFLNEYSKDHAPSSVNKTKGLIKSCLDSAVADGLIRVNFSLGSQATGNKKKKLVVIYPNVEQIENILNLALERRKPYYPSFYIIITAILTGMRLAEICGLTWDRIDVENRTFKIDRAYNHLATDKEHIFKTLKNESSYRTIRVSHNLISVLSELKVNGSNLVFAEKNNPYKVPYSNGVKHPLKKIIKDLDYNLGDFHFHSLRHCHVALLHHDGIDWYSISKRLGHENLTTTLKTYAYLVEEDKIKSDDLIETQLDNFLTIGEKIGETSKKHKIK
ncbi:site-specific integrase [Lactobacillus hominis]|uniref:Integrase n=1 Tax=Lactobacillus hominis DSM 23910 = CRBIP 24.179 TaxID=1423758 RepID=I7LA76_9LACO|nr:site-specific integrase [Lactobacillus hominis]KRM85783.1 bacteriophage integrase [Lactobacillus hominis DSM 23910 = CRBIP 24.179]MCT3347171.1 site-specific integrase [Lactobacillus hominis]CCI82024.1 Integrase [Lactobacillus hominis DSM 23910 = CRBIP 24.179]